MNSNCRFCNSVVKNSFCDLGITPLSNSYLLGEQLGQKEPTFPLHAWVCDHCLLVQVEEFEKPESIFSDYSYFSSYSDSWLEHAKCYANLMMERFNIGPKNQVIEIASNDGYLLQFFKQRQIPILGIEPAKNVAAVAQAKGIPTLIEFFGLNLAKSMKAKGIAADLIVANNVLAHVPNLNDFVAGFKALLNSTGVATVEFPHLLNLIQENQFDTIYHEHFSYFSFHTVERVFAKHGMALFDVERISTHGGSLRIYARHVEDTSKPFTSRVNEIKELERINGLLDLSIYLRFDDKIKSLKKKFTKMLFEFKNQNKHVIAYGAPAKGNTLLNFCGINTELIQYSVDRSPHKQGKYLPGSLIPIYSPEKIAQTKPDYIVILPWNLKEEIITQLHFVRDWGGKFIIPIPEPKVIA